MAPLVPCCHLGKEGDLSYKPLITSLILRRERAGLVFPLALEKPWKVFFCWHFPPPHFPTNDPSSQTSALISVARVLSCLLRQKGALVGMDSVGSRGKKPIGKETFHPSLGTETTGKLCFPLSQPRTWSPQVSPAKSIQPGASRVQCWERAPSLPLLHWWDRIAPSVPGIATSFLVNVYCFK